MARVRFSLNCSYLATSMETLGLNERGVDSIILVSTIDGEELEMLSVDSIGSPASVKD